MKKLTMSELQSAKRRASTVCDLLHSDYRAVRQGISAHWVQADPSTESGRIHFKTLNEYKAIARNLKAEIRALEVTIVSLKKEMKRRVLQTSLTKEQSILRGSINRLEELVERLN